MRADGFCRILGKYAREHAGGEIDDRHTFHARSDPLGAFQPDQSRSDDKNARAFAD